MLQGFPEIIYNELLCKLEEIKALELPEDKEIEESFRECISQEKKITEWLSIFKFDTEADEIYFFKHILPKISRLIPYYKKRYQEVMFKPPDIIRQLSFFEYELDKVEKFFSDNAAFYQYYKSELSIDDRIYFLHCFWKATTPEDPNQSWTDYDLLLANIQGYEMYKSYLQQQLKQLKNPNFRRDQRF